MLETPAVQWGPVTEYPKYVLKQLNYENEPYGGKATRVFAYYAVPHQAVEPLPVMVLVHGGAGKAFPEWAAQWAERGYAAIAMDLFGNGHDGNRMPDGGPAQTDETLFMNLSEDTITQMWSYHAVAAVIRAVSLAASLPETDARRIGLMGISWGGYITEIVSGLDPRPAYAMSAYAAGYFQQGSCWMDILSRMDDSQRSLWNHTFDVSSYIGRSSMPILWATWTNDPCFYLESWSRTHKVAHGEATLRLLKDWDHNYEVPWGTREFFRYADSHARGGPPLPTVLRTGEARNAAWAEFKQTDRIKQAYFLYTADDGSAPSRVWETLPADIDPASYRITSTIPGHARMYCFNLIDEEGYVVSSELREVRSEPILASEDNQL
ncbi:alpha/beta fold hydrolase [Paenibacillus spongiae]|uniref:Acetylxylan esterase n=1 Tax=Paenibacillus spongiae TaxID=2909671 RepID=A0ABY5S0Z4_9BACL|nr:alpha/beta fold hydrolase [Paenibacillus spongiae]UVI27526.1 acetylxylan esterase [Paenibacillus spongiae]